MTEQNMHVSKWRADWERRKRLYDQVEKARRLSGGLNFCVKTCWPKTLRDLQSLRLVLLEAEATAAEVEREFAPMVPVRKIHEVQ